MGDVIGRLCLLHPGHRITQGDALVERGESTEADPSAQSRLTYQKTRERCVRIHLRRAQEPEPLELV